MTKALGLPEIQPSSLVNELLGGRLAVAYGLAAPATDVILISPAFLDAAAADLAVAGVQLRAGLAVGAAFIPNLLAFPTPAKLLDDEINEAAAIYTFDLLIQNPDRRAHNPNCGRAGRRIVPYDFETAFSFRFDFVKRDPWRVAGLPFAAKHLFHAELASCQPDWSAVFARFRALTTTDLREVCSTLPDDWADAGSGILAHLTAVTEHQAEFERDVLRSLEKVL